MPPVNWKNLEQLRRIEALAPDRAEIGHHLALAREYRDVSRKAGLPERQRFLNLYEAAHSASLAGMLLAGYRPKEGEGNRILPLSIAEETLALKPGSAAAFSEANRLRSAAKYHGVPVDFPGAMMEALEAGVDEALDEVAVRLKALRRK